MTTFEPPLVRQGHREIGRRQIDNVPQVESLPRHAESGADKEPPEATLIEAAEAGAAQDG